MMTPKKPSTTTKSDAVADSITPNEDPWDEGVAAHRTPKSEDALAADPNTRALPLDDKPKAPPAALAFTSGDERRMTGLALRAYVQDLKTLAKKATEMGRGTDASGMLRDAAMLSDTLLTQLDSQASLPLNETGTALDALTHTVGQRVRQGVGRTLNETEAKTFEKMFGKIAELTANAVLPIIHELAQRAFDAGARARDLTPETLARQAIFAASSQRDGSAE